MASYHLAGNAPVVAEEWVFVDCLTFIKLLTALGSIKIDVLHTHTTQ